MKSRLCAIVIVGICAGLCFAQVTDTDVKIVIDPIAVYQDLVCPGS